MFFLWEEALHFHLLAPVLWGPCFRFLPSRAEPLMPISFTQACGWRPGSGAEGSVSCHLIGRHRDLDEAQTSYVLGPPCLCSPNTPSCPPL